MRQRAFYLPLTTLAAVPDVIFETLFRREGGHAGKMFGYILLRGGEDINAQATVLLQDGQNVGAAVDAGVLGGVVHLK